MISHTLSKQAHIRTQDGNLSMKKVFLLTPFKMNVLYLLLALWMIPGVSLAQTLDQTPVSTPLISPLKGKIQYQQEHYLLGPGDVLSLKVLHEPDYDQDDILIRPDGEASVVGVGEMQMANETVGSVKDLIEAELSRTLVKPQVLLTVTSLRAGTFYLSGAFMHPGMFQFTTDTSDKQVSIRQDETILRTDMRLTNILANAGGVKMQADLHNVTVTKSLSGEKVVVDLWKVLKEGASQEDIWVNSGDQIHIPENSKMALNDEDYTLLLSSSIGPKYFPIRVLGEVTTPGVYNLEGNSPLMNSALAKAGGFAPQANRHVVAIRRFTDENTFTTLFVDLNKLDFVLRPNDVLFVSENKLYRTGRYAAEVARVFSPFQSAATSAASSAQVFGLGGWNRAF